MILEMFGYYKPTSADVQYIKEKFDELDRSIDKKNQTIKTLRSENENLKSENADLKRRIAELERYNNRVNNIKQPTKIWDANTNKFIEKD